VTAEVDSQIDHANRLLATHRELRSFACVRLGDRYDAKLVLVGATILILRIYGLERISGDALPYCASGLVVRDIRSEQHDRMRYELTDFDGDSVLLRCERLALTHGGERTELS
jgi:hypothetical protein